MEIKLSDVNDPLAYLSSVLKKQVQILKFLQETPKNSIQIIYAENTDAIDSLFDRIENRWMDMVSETIGMGNADDPDFKNAANRLETTIKEATEAAQAALTLFDDFCVRYSLPTKEPILFSKIGTLLYSL